MISIIFCEKTTKMGTKNKLLVLAVFPAPYRAHLIEYLSNAFEVDAFYERDFDSNRDSAWFIDNTKILTKKENMEDFKKACSTIKQYDAVVLYDYTSINSIKLIRKCKKNKIPYFVNCDGIIVGKKDNFLKGVIKKLLLSKATACFASGKYASQYFEKYGVDKRNIFIHKFSSLEQQDILKEVPNKDRSFFSQYVNFQYENIFLGVGRFMGVKNYSWLINGWPRNQKDVLVLIGGGELKQEYENRIHERQLVNIILIDYLDKNTLKNYFRNADFFLHPTTYDAWGLVVNEAMSQGLIVASSNKCIAALELIKNKENGFLFDCDISTPIELIDSLASLSEKERYRIRQNAISTISEYTIKNMAETQIDIIKKRLVNKND